MRARRTLTVLGATAVAVTTAVVVPATGASAAATTQVAFSFGAEPVFAGDQARTVRPEDSAPFTYTVRQAPRGAAIVLQRTTKGKYSRDPSRFQDVRTLVAHSDAGLVRGRGTLGAPLLGHYRYRVVVETSSGRTAAVSTARNVYTYDEDAELTTLIGEQGKYIVRVEGEDADFYHRFPPEAGEQSGTRTDTYRHTTCRQIRLFGALPRTKGSGTVRVSQDGRDVGSFTIRKADVFGDTGYRTIHSGTLSLTYSTTTADLYYDGRITCWTPTGRSVA